MYVYAIKDPRTGDPIYVGKGTGRRMNLHWWAMLNDYKNSLRSIHNRKLRNKLTAIFRAGYLEPIYEKLFESPDENLCYWMERFWIDVLGRETLCNLSDGGTGNYAHEVSEETREKLRIANTGKKLTEDHKAKINPLGRKHSEETKKKIGEGNKGKTCMTGESNPFFGKTHTEESRRKMSVSLMGKGKGRPKSEETRKRMSEGRKAYWAAVRKAKSA